MKKILVIKDGLSTGGTTSSFFAFLEAMKSQAKYKVFVWINKNVKSDGEFANCPYEYGSAQLERCFKQPKTVVEKLVLLIKNRQLLLYLGTKAIPVIKYNNSKIIQSYQLMDILKAKRQKAIELEDFDAVITWEEFYPCYLLAEAVKTKKKIAWIHPDYIQCGFNSKYDKPVFEKLDAIVAVSEAGQQSLKKAMPDYENKFMCVENCVNVTDIRHKAKELQNDMLKEDGGINIVTVARLQNISKALDRAVRIASKLKKAGHVFKWFFVGNGEDYNNMRTLIDENDVNDCMILLGHKDNPYPYMANADLFVLQSYYEGKPMVVDEAMIVGTPVLVSNYAAAKEQVLDGCGWVAENNEDDIYRRLEDLLNNRDKLLACKEKLAKLDINRFMDCSAYINMLDEVLNNDSKNI